MSDDVQAVAEQLEALLKVNIRISPDGQLLGITSKTDLSQMGAELNHALGEMKSKMPAQASAMRVDVFKPDAGSPEDLIIEVKDAKRVIPLMERDPEKFQNVTADIQLNQKIDRAKEMTAAANEYTQRVKATAPDLTKPGNVVDRMFQEVMDKGNRLEAAMMSKMPPETTIEQPTVDQQISKPAAVPESTVEPKSAPAEKIAPIAPAEAAAPQGEQDNIRKQVNDVQRQADEIQAKVAAMRGPQDKSTAPEAVKPVSPGEEKTAGKMGINVAEDMRAKRLIDKVDINKDGKVTAEEVKNAKITREDVDINKDGKVNEFDFKKLDAKLKEAISPEVRAMISGMTNVGGNSAPLPTEGKGKSENQGVNHP